MIFQQHYNQIRYTRPRPHDELVVTDVVTAVDAQVEMEETETAEDSLTYSSPDSAMIKSRQSETNFLT